MKIDVAPYRYLCDGQLTNCVPQPGTDRRLDAQGDKIMSRLVYRRVHGHESIVATHSVDDQRRRRRRALVRVAARSPNALRSSTSRERSLPMGSTAGWAASPWTATAISASATRLAARRTSPDSALPRAWTSDPKGQLTLAETVLVEGEDAQTSTMPVGRLHHHRARSRTTTARSGMPATTSRRTPRPIRDRIGAFRLPGCRSR